MTKDQIKEFIFRTSNANHSGLMIILFDMERIYLEDAISNYTNGDMDEYLHNMDFARRVHNEIMSGVNPKDNNGRKYLSILRFIYTKLIASCVKRKPVELDRCKIMMDNLREGFVAINKIEAEEPVMKNAHKVYAGLTYGKGVLNESISGTDYSKRGFKA